MRGPTDQLCLPLPPAHISHRAWPVWVSVPRAGLGPSLSPSDGRASWEGRKAACRADPSPQLSPPELGPSPQTTGPAFREPTGLLQVAEAASAPHPQGLLDFSLGSVVTARNQGSFSQMQIPGPHPVLNQRSGAGPEKLGLYQEHRVVLMHLA